MSAPAVSSIDPIERPHVLVVDDDTRIRELVGKYLKQNDFTTTVAENADTARKILEVIQFDAVVLDIMMPGEDGLSLAKSLQPDFTTPILFLTAKGDADDRIAGLEAGADDYLAKPFEPRELVLRLNAILKRSQSPSTKVMHVSSFDGWVFDNERALLTKGADAQPLTRAEANLLNVMIQKPRKVFARDELAKLVNLEGQERTVDVQVTRLRRKIEPDAKKPRYLQTVRGEGYILYVD
jgi:two-component system, OmpR family, phosphate regulon response regulator OmpR